MNTRAAWTSCGPSLHTGLETFRKRHTQGQVNVNGDLSDRRQRGCEGKKRRETWKGCSGAGTGRDSVLATGDKYVSTLSNRPTGTSESPANGQLDSSRRPRRRSRISFCYLPLDLDRPWFSLLSCRYQASQHVAMVERRVSSA